MTTETILIVEDDAALLDGLRDILELSGYRVVTARNGAQGLVVLEQHQPDLILSDINMPRMDGYQFYSQVRAHPEWVSLPFIFLTAKGEKADVRRGKMLGVDDYLTKPFEEADLLVAVQAKLNRRNQLNAARERQISDLKRTILTTLNHEFRTPLTYITTYADMLGESNVSQEDFKNFMRGIQVGSDRLRRLVEDFIFLVELQTGEAQQTYERRRQPLNDLARLLNTVVERFQQRAREKGVSVEASLATSLPAVVGDAEYLSNAIGRLVDNAIKFSKKGGGMVVVRAQPGDLSLVIEVSDEGIGMPAAEQAKIFDVFHQIDRAKMEQQGSGSGLAITHGIVSLHGGRLTATSELNVGSTFRIELPLAPV